MITIENIQDEPIDYFPYLNVGGGRKRMSSNIVRELLPIYEGTLNGLPDSLDALIICSDLQGNVMEDDSIYLLGEVLPEKLLETLQNHHPEILPGRVGVFLCGDMYANLQKRGGLGDVRTVWWSFREAFAWVAGVAGNHDEFGDHQDKKNFKRENGIYLLENESQEIDGMRVAGVGGIIGNPKKPNRTEKFDFLDMVEERMEENPEFLLLHEGPSVKEQNLMGNPDIREAIEAFPANFICCGHSHWKVHSATLSNNATVLNADAKAFIFKFK